MTAWIVAVAIVFLPLVFGILLLGPQTKIRVSHSESGLSKSGYVGFSWTYYFFGFFVPVFRGEIPIAFFHLVLSILTLGFFQLVMSFLYNKQYTIRLLTNGWELNDTDEKKRLALRSLEKKPH